MRFTARPLVPLVVALVAVSVTQTVARADYVWATVESGTVRFALLENANAAPNPQFEKYVAGLSPSYDGKPLTLGSTKEGAYYASLPTGRSAGKSVVIAEKVVGVRERDGETYLLVYHAKGAVSLAAAKTITKAPAEVAARRDKEKLVISVFQEGKPVPNSEIWVQWPGDETASSVQTDSKGEVQVPWSTKGSGFISIRAKVNEVKTGEHEGKPYPKVRRWATLAFPIEGTKAPATAIPQ